MTHHKYHIITLIIINIISISHLILKLSSLLLQAASLIYPRLSCGDNDYFICLPPDCTLLQETPVRLAEAPVCRASQGGAVSLGPAGPRLALLPFCLRLLAVNPVWGGKRKLEGERSFYFLLLLIICSLRLYSSIFLSRFSGGSFIVSFSFIYW